MKQSNNLPRTKPEDKKVVSTTQVASFSGPLPPPHTLEQYEKVAPGSAERIIKMAEDQSVHRKTLESQTIKSDITNAKIGLVFGFIIGMTGLISGAYIAVKGQSLTGGFFGVGSLVALTSVFVYGSRNKKQILNQKQRNLNQ